MFRANRKREQSVKCGYPNCGNYTLHKTKLCIHHRRVSDFRQQSQQADQSRSATPIGSPRSAHARWLEHATSVGTRAMDRYPGVTVDNGRVRISYALYDDDKLTWNRETFELNETEEVRRGVAVIKRIGYDVLVVLPPGTSRVGHEVSYAMAASRAALYRRYRSLGILDGLAEEYEDTAEILAYVGHGDLAENCQVSYAATDYSSVRLSLKTDTGAMEVYEVSENGWSVSSATSYLQREHAVTSASRSRTGQSEQIPMTESEAFPRMKLLQHVIGVMNLVKRHGIVRDGTVYLPSGWRSELT